VEQVRLVLRVTSDLSERPLLADNCCAPYGRFLYIQRTIGGDHCAVIELPIAAIVAKAANMLICVMLPIYLIPRAFNGQLRAVQHS